MLLSDFREAPRASSFTVPGICLVFLLALGVLSCSDNGANCPGPTPLPSGRAVVNASVREDQQGHFYLEGFSFSEGEVVTFPNLRDTAPDLSLMFMTGVDGDIQGLLLTQFSDQPGGFYHVGTGQTLEQGRAVFDETVCLPEGARFEDIAGPARPSQVWAVKTGEGKFGKILILDTFFCTQEHDSAGIKIVCAYGEITFDWQYQPDGTSCFNEP